MKTLTYIATIAAAALSIWPAYASDRQDDIAVLTDKKVNQWRSLYAERNARGLREFLADSFVVMQADGAIQTKQDEVEWLEKTPRAKEPNDFIFTIKNIIFGGKNTAVVYGHGDSTRKMNDGSPCHHRYWSSNTFIKENGTWKPTFSHVSGSSCEPLE